MLLSGSRLYILSTFPNHSQEGWGTSYLKEISEPVTVSVQFKRHDLIQDRPDNLEFPSIFVPSFYCLPALLGMWIEFLQNIAGQHTGPNEGCDRIF